MKAQRIGVLVGSLRAGSYTRKVAKAIIELTPGLAFIDVPFRSLSLYDQDLDTDSPPEAWADLRDLLRGMTGYLFCTPEYNRSVPGVLKNAIDIASRPYGKSAFGKGKPAAVVSVSPGSLGAFGANHHLRQSLTFLDLIPLQQPELYITNAGKLFDDQDRLVNADTKQLLASFGDAFTQFVAKLST